MENEERKVQMEDLLKFFKIITQGKELRKLAPNYF